MSVFTLLPFVMACALSDLITRRIPNTLILCGLIGALLSRFYLVLQSVSSSAGTLSSGQKALALLSVPAEGCAGFLLPWLLLGVPAALKMIGGGDVKLLSVIGLQLGPGRCLTVLWYTLIIAAFWSAVLVIRRRNLVQRFEYLYRYVGQAMVSRQAGAYRSPDGSPQRQDRSGEFCLALPILLALFLVLCGL